MCGKGPLRLPAPRRRQLPQWSPCSWSAPSRWRRASPCRFLEKEVRSAFLRPCFQDLFWTLVFRSSLSWGPFSFITSSSSTFSTASLRLFGVVLSSLDLLSFLRRFLALRASSDCFFHFGWFRPVFHVGGFLQISVDFLAVHSYWERDSQVWLKKVCMGMARQLSI